MCKRPRISSPNGIIFFSATEKVRPEAFVLAPDTQKFESEPEEPGIAISNVIVPDSQDTEEQVEEKVNVDQVFITDLDATICYQVISIAQIVSVS